MDIGARAPRVTTQTCDLGPSRALGWAQAALGLALAAGAAAADPGGRVLLVPAAVLLVVLGLQQALLWPVLSLRPDGLVVVTGLRRTAVPWRDLESAQVVTDRRAPLLQLDLGETLVVLSRRRLGTSPAEALALLAQVRPA